MSSELLQWCTHCRDTSSKVNHDTVICQSYDITRKNISANDTSFASSGYGISISLASQDEYSNHDDVSSNKNSSFFSIDIMNQQVVSGAG